jgi:indole-3-glycerol phosphate synthase
MTILDTIVAHKKTEIAGLPESAQPPVCCCDFSDFLQSRPSLIAEVKAASPSEGLIVKSFDPVQIAQDYSEGGADAISVLTDQRFFQGSFEILKEIRRQTEKPLLCKDFIIDEKQVRHARSYGADLCLLIVKILTAEQLNHLKSVINDLGMKAVIEVQTAIELDTALKVSPEIILINNRNLTDFTVDMNTTQGLLDLIPDGIKIIAASGITSPAQIAHFPARVDGFLIGTALMRSVDKVGFLKACRAVQSPNQTFLAQG